MERNAIIPVNLADEQIQVKRPSLITSGSIHLYFLSSANQTIGGVSIWLITAPGKIRLEKCSPWFEAATLPTASEQIWTISRAEDTILIDCNGEEVFRRSLSNDTCTEDPGWQNHWKQSTTGILFGKEWDTTFDLYRLVPVKGKIYGFMDHYPQLLFGLMAFNSIA